MSSVTNLHPPAGMVIQVVHGTLSGQVAVTGNNTGGADYIVDIGLNATITPRFANSRIKIDVRTSKNPLNRNKVTNSDIMPVLKSWSSSYRLY